MPLTEMNKNIIKWGLVSLVGIGLVITIVLLLKKSSQTNNVTVNLTLHGPYLKPQIASMNLDKGILSSMTVGQLIGSAINTTKILQWPISDTYWLNMTISGKIVQISDGQITSNASQQNLYNMLGITSPPTSINITASYKNSCSPVNYPTNLNPCLGQTGICTSTGWIVADYTYCPSDDILVSCCTGPNNPYATCVDNKVVCGQCPGSLDCGDPTCGLFGPKCTSTGWVCAPGYACPTGSSLSSCCTGTDHATCTIVAGRASLICSGCIGTPPVCIPDCNMCGLVCNIDGTWSCRQGASCPPENIMDSCCKDPNNPRAFCSPPITNGPLCTEASENNVKCDNCQTSTKPPDTKCEQGSCEGHGYVCTSTGWVCAPGVVCPDRDKFDWKQCCPDSYDRNQPYCDSDSNCIKCACPEGSTGCGNISYCGVPRTQCDQKCCPNGFGCTTDPKGDCICCPSQQTCVSSTGVICCQDGMICQNGYCVVECGKDSSGQPFACQTSQMCLEIDNLSPGNIAKLKQEYGNNVRINGTSAFICKDEESSCYMQGNENSLPASQNNYYPCFSFPSFNDPNEPGAGYCTESNNNPTGQCFTKHKTSKDCNADSNCTWRNVLRFMTTNTNIGIPALQITKEMEVIQNERLGEYCDPSSGTTPYSRVVGFTTDPTKCSWDDCWARIAQPGVVDVEYNSANGVCVAMEACNGGSSTMQSWLVNSKGSTGPNPLTTPLPNQQNPQGNSSFPDCKVAVCPPSLGNEYTCIGNCDGCTAPGKLKTGQLVYTKYGCSPEDNYNCVIDGIGPYNDYNICLNSQSCCPAGMTRHNNHCYNYNPPGPDPAAPNSTVPCCSATEQCPPFGSYGGQIGSGNCKGQAENNNFSTWNFCCDPKESRGACVETAATPIPYGAFYCNGNSDTYSQNCLEVCNTGGCNEDGSGGNTKAQSQNGTWTLCQTPGGCKMHDNTGDGTIYWRCENGGSDGGNCISYHYCSWPPPS